MIITKKRPYNGIKKELSKKDKIGVISCNACARMCKTGGREALEELAGKLKNDGFEVVDMDLIGTPCNIDMLEKNQLHGNAQVALCCDAGIENLKQIFPKNKIIPALKTIGLGAYNNKGKIRLIREFK